MAEERIDVNSRNVWGLQNDTSGFIENARVDSIFNGLEIYLGSLSSGTYTAIDRAKIDGNHRNTLSAFNESTSGIEALRCNDNGELLVILV